MHAVLVNEQTKDYSVKYFKVKKKKPMNIVSVKVLFLKLKEKLGLISLYIRGILIDSYTLSFRSFTFSKYNWHVNWHKAPQ